ncbi:methionine aminotransferase [Sphingobacterium suaedae]|uniref:Methionine aminotransferase n=1 Tax=Sphingobacterium suaedae TaxID=1686402 RepID=A0ABW5KKZ5_9SPHI
MSTTFPYHDSKLPNITWSIFSQMSALAEQYQAINLSQGFPNYPASDRLVALVEKYLRGGYNQYAPMAGVVALREVLAAKVQALYQLNVDPLDEVTITAGGTQALFTAIASIIQPGDEVILFEPAYDSYSPSVEVFGGKVVPIRLRGPAFKIDWDQVREAISTRTKLIIINNPNNPSAMIFSRADLLELERLLAGTAIFLLSDEVYEHLVFDGERHHSVLEFSHLRERSFVVASFGKLLHTTGWKLGYVIAPPRLSQEFRKVHQFNVFSVNTPMQHAIAEFLTDTDTYRSLPAFFQQKRDYLASGLAMSRFRVLPSAGTYFLLIDYSGVSALSELEFAKKLTIEHGVATIPVSSFYSIPLEQRLLRLCFAKSEDTLQQAISALANV